MSTDDASRLASPSSDLLGPLSEPVGHLHSDGEFCQDRAVDSPVWWPVNLYTEDQLRAVVAAEREWWKQAAEAMAQEADRKFPANGTVAHWLRALVAKRGA